MMNIDDHYCLELLQRAVVQHDIHARNTLQQHFSELLHQWMRSHPKREMAFQLNSEEHYVTEALERFWQVLSLHQPEASNFLIFARRYLHLSLNSTIIDTLRTSSRRHRIPVVEVGETIEPRVELHEIQCICWEVIEHILPNKRTRRLAYLLFYCGLQPKAIVSTYPQEFNDIEEIYRLWPAIANQLSRVAICVHQPTQDDNTEFCTPSTP